MPRRPHQRKPSWLSSLPELTKDQKEVAQFRGRDALWAAVGDLYDHYREEDKVSYASLGDRIGKRRSQVQRWLARPINMTLASAGLLAEGLDADLHIEVRPRDRSGRANEAHPIEEAMCVILSRKPIRSIDTHYQQANEAESTPLPEDESLSSKKITIKKALDVVA